MTSCQALYDKVKKLNGSIGEIQDFCGKSIRSIEKILVHIDFSEKHGLKESDIPYTPLRPLIDLEQKNPKAVKKAVKSLKTMLESGKKVTGNMVGRLVREAKGEPMPERAPRVSVDLPESLMELYVIVYSKHDMKFASFTEFVTKTVQDRLEQIQAFGMVPAE